MQKIALDVRTNHLSGIYRYGSSQLGYLAVSMAEAGVHVSVLYGPDLDAGRLAALTASVAPHGAQMVFVPDNPGFTRDSPWLRDWLVRHEVDLYHSFHYVVDVLCPVPFSLCLHDLIRLKHAQLSYTDETFRAAFGDREFEKMKRDLYALRTYVPMDVAAANGSRYFIKYIWAIMRYLSEQSQQVITVSEAVKCDITRMLGVRPDKVSVVPDAADRTIFYLRAAAEVSGVLEKFRLDVDQPYVLYVGTNHPHKRLRWLLEVLSRCAPKARARAKLVIVGQYVARDASVAALVRRLGLEGAVTFTGQVTDDELACLYTGARALAVTSADEGFCLPALEALCCGCEVIVPDLRVLHETTGGHAHFYRPNDGERLASYLTEAFERRLPHEAAAFHNRFSWAASAGRLSDLLLDFLAALEEQQVPLAANG